MKNAWRLRLLPGLLVGLLLTLATPPSAHAAVTVTLGPLDASTPVSGTRQITATVAGATSTAVTWSVNGIAGGNTSVGTISAAPDEVRIALR